MFSRFNFHILVIINAVVLTLVDAMNNDKGTKL